MEVRLLHAPLVERDLAVERGRERVDGAAFHLGAHLVRVHGDAAVDRTYEAVHPNATVGRHGDLGHVRRVGAVGERHRDATRAARGQRRAPARALGGGVEHGEVTRRLAEQRAAVLVGVLARRMRQLVDE